MYSEVLSKIKIYNKRDKILEKVTWLPHFIPFKYAKTDEESYNAKKVRGRGMRESVIDFLSKLMKGRVIDKNKRDKIEKPKTRRQKSYPIYKLVQRGNIILSLFKRVTLKEFKEHYNINETNKVVGWTPDFVGSMKSAPVEGTNYIFKMLKRAYKNILEKTDEFFIKDMNKSLAEYRVVFSAGFDSAHDHLKEYFKDNNKNELLSEEHILKVLKCSNFEWFKSVECRFDDSRELFANVRINKKAYAGHYTSLIKGQNKGKSEYSSRAAAVRILEALRIKPIKNLYLWSVLGREKDIKIVNSDKNEYKEVGTRAVLSCENPPTILLLWFAQTISYILSLNKNKTFNISGEFNGEKAYNLCLAEKNYDWRIEADWTFFDSNIDTSLLKIAGCILLSRMPEDRLHKNIIYYIIKSIITKYVLLPPGIVVELNRAQPSGHPFGSLINCYVNTIYWSLIGYEIYGESYSRNMKIEVYGDDTYAFFKHNPKLFKIDEIVTKLSLKSEPLIDKILPTKFRMDRNEEIDFLKRRITREGIQWNHKKMFDKLFYQSKKRNLDEQILLLFSYVELAPTDKNVKIFVETLIHEIVKSGYDSEIKDENLRDRVNGIQSGRRKLIEICEDKGNASFKEKKFNSSVIKYSYIYSYSSINKFDKTRELFVFNKTPELKEILLTSLGFTIDQINNEKAGEFIFGDRAPPVLINKNWLEIIFDFYEKEATMAEKFISRIYRRISNKKLIQQRDKL